MHFPLSSCKKLPPAYSIVHFLHRLYGVDAAGPQMKIPGAAIGSIKAKEWTEVMQGQDVPSKVKYGRFV